MILTTAAILTYLINHMESMSHHITPLVINSLGGGHTHTHVRTETILINEARAGISRPVRAKCKSSGLATLFMNCANMDS